MDRFAKLLNEHTPWYGTEAPVQSTPQDRSAYRYDLVLDQFRVEESTRYRKTDKDTFCSTFLWDVTRAMGAEIPHWVDAADFSVPEWKGRELNANALHPRLLAGRWGYAACTVEEAQRRADAGCPTVFTWHNPSGGHGHVGLVVPRRDGDPLPVVAQAGEVNKRRTSLDRVFGPAKLPGVRFFWHS